MRTFNKGSKLPGEVLTSEECKDLMASFSSDFIGTRNKAIVTILWRSQLRCSEALDLMHFDIDFIKPSITVRNGKGGKRRVVGIDRDSTSHIYKWQMIRDKTCDYFFHTRSGGRIHDSYIRKMIKAKFSSAGYTKRIHPHALRHTGAHEMACEGIDVRIIQKQLGHSTLAVTHTYLDHLYPEDVINAISARTTSL